MNVNDVTKRAALPSSIAHVMMPSSHNPWVAEAGADANTKEVSPVASDAKTDERSAAISFQPSLGANQPTVPGSTVAIDARSALVHLPNAAAATMSAPDFLARSQSNLAAGYDLATARDGDGRVGLTAFGDLLEDALRPDATGRTSFDYQREALEGRRDQLMRRLEQGGPDTASIVRELDSVNEYLRLVEREREKHERLRNLIISLLLGVVPQDTVKRLKELGLGDLVEQLIPMMVGNGAGLSKGEHREVAALASLGISVQLVDEADTAGAQRERTLLERDDVTADRGRSARGIEPVRATSIQDAVLAVELLPTKP